MKTKGLIAGIALAALSMTACSGNGDSNSNAPEAKTFNDSVAMYNGIIAGTNALQTYNSLPDTIKAKFDRDKFLAGMQMIIDADTSHNFQDGIQMGINLMNSVYEAKNAGVELDSKLMFAYFKQAFLQEKIDTAKMEAMGPALEGVMSRFQEKLQTYAIESQIRMQAQMQQMFTKNVTEGKKFLDQVRKDPEVKTTQSGLSYKIEKMGTGAVAKEGDTAHVIYTGKLPNGQVFDSSDNQVAEFPVDQVVPGFKEALTTFPIGTKLTLYVPQELGYGQQGSPAVQPGQTMVFEMEICE